MSSNPRRTMAVGAVGAVLFLLAMGPSIVGAEPDPPPPFYVSMESNTAFVNATLDQNYSLATLNGSIITNYPGYKYDIYIETVCGSSPTTTTPEHVEMRGKNTIDFTIGISLVKGDGPNTTCMGKVSITAIMSTPGNDNLYLVQGSIMAQAQWPIPEWRTSPPADEDQLAWQGKRTSSKAAEDLETGALITVGVLTVAVLVIVRRKLNRSPRRRAKA